MAILKIALLRGHLRADPLAGLAIALQIGTVAVNPRLTLGARDLRIDAVDLLVERVDLALDLLGEGVAGLGVEQVAGLARLFGTLFPKRLDVQHWGRSSRKSPARRRG